MKYFNLIALNRAIIIIREGDNTNGYRTGSVANGLANHYFGPDKFIVTLGQIQPGTVKKPDLSIEKYITDKNEFIPHCFIEVKSNFTEIIQQLHDSIIINMNDLGFYSNTYLAFIIGIKGTKIAFYAYHSFFSLLDDYGIDNYKRFIPLNELININSFMLFCKNSNSFPIVEEIYNRYLLRITFNTDSNVLAEIGALPMRDIKHPHVLDLLNKLHKEDIHKMFIFTR